MVMSSVALMALFILPALAQEDTEVDQVKSMLEGIPEIVAPQAEQAQKKQAVNPEGMALDAYFRACRKVVHARFKMPKKILRTSPSVEVFFLVSVDLEGNILGVTAPKRSGFRAWDAAALDALNKVGRLPVPPQGWSVADDKVLIPFNRHSR
jgi:hypothetical protein